MSHYVLINNLSRLFHSKTLHQTKFHCPHCIVKCYSTMDLLNIHVDKCLNVDTFDRVKINVLTECPIEGKHIKIYSSW